MKRRKRAHVVGRLARVQVTPVSLVIVQVESGPGSEAGLVVVLGLVGLKPRVRTGARFLSSADVAVVGADDDPEIEEDEGADNGDEASVEVEPTFPE